MTKNELLNILNRVDTVMTRAECGEALALFEADAQAHFDLVEFFSEARIRIAQCDNSSETTIRLHVCAQKYLANLMKAPAKYRDAISEIYADEVGYYSVRNDQAMALHYANEVLDRESVPDVIYSRVLGLAIDSLLKLGMYSEAGRYVERLEVFVESHTLPTRQLYMMYANLAYGYAFIGNGRKFEEFRKRLDEIDRSGLPTWLIYFCDLYLLGSLTRLNGDGRYDDEFASEYKRLIENNTGEENQYTMYSTYLIDEAFLLLPIFEKAWKTVGPDAVLESIELLMQNSSSVSERADYYSWFFDKMKADRVRFAKQYETYMDVLREYRFQNDENHRREVADEMIRHEFEDKYRRQATIDSLTGLLNRFVYETEIDELRNMEELPENLHVVMADLDNLKKTNDTLGHQVGDELIRGVGGCLSNAFGRLGRVFRIGGDEFIALVYCDAKALEKATAALTRLINDWSGDSGEHLHCAIGYASAAGNPGKSILQLLRLAEEMMYIEKNRFYSLPGNDRRKH